MTEGYRPTAEPQLARTDLHCHQCSKTFVAELDFTIEGNHVVECPHCGHEHFRVIKGGAITDDRWHSGMRRVDVSPRSVWKSNVLKAQTSTAAQFIRDAWLNRADLSL